MVNGNGTFVYNGYDADGSWYPPEEPVIPRVYHEKARDFNIKDLLYPEANTTEEEEEEQKPIPVPVEPGPVIIDPDQPDTPDPVVDPVQPDEPTDPVVDPIEL